MTNAFALFYKGRQREKKNDVPTYLPFFLRFFEIFRSDFRKYVYGVFGLLMQRNGQKRDKKKLWEKTTGKKFFFLNFFGQKLLTWSSPKKLFVVFLNSPCPLLRNAQKRHKTKVIKINKKKYLPTPFSDHLPDIRRFQKKILWRPLFF
jgi:hypothetical protein